jgi:hypothetical protein
MKRLAFVQCNKIEKEVPKRRQSKGELELQEVLLQ